MGTIINRNDLHLLKLLRPHARLRDKLARATTVPAQKVPTDVVTMNSKVRYRDDAVDTPRDVKLVYPGHADGSGRISVLSPLGTALLGLSVGQEVEECFPGLGVRRLCVQALISQPEREARRLTLDEKLDEALK